MRHLFIPGESNNHRAKLLHNKSLVFAIIILLVGQVFLSAIKTNFSGVLGTSTNISLERLLLLTNQKRNEQGLPSLAINPQLSQAALFKAKDMYAKNYWAHNSPEGTTPWFFFKESGYEYTYAGENLARGFTTSDDTVDAWMNSASHRENVLSPNYNEIGFAVLPGNLLGEDTTLVVEMFGSRGTPSFAKQIMPEQNIIESVEVIVTPTVPVPIAISFNEERSEKVVSNKSDSVFAQSVKSMPLINSRSLSWNLSFIIISLFILILTIDMIIIERRKIIRVVGHNLDHIFFLVALLLFVIIFTRGFIL